ncbi:MAG: thiamine pyrophosphate-dependent enzyme [Promethearchaeota archaeon]
MKRKEALETIMENVFKTDAIITSTGLICREMYEYFDTEQQFYMPGSMGLTSSIDLGIALNKPNKRIIIIEGDASILMNLGSIITIDYFTPKNLVHIILNNGAYASCSEESTLGNHAKLDKIAELAGYHLIFNINTKFKLQEAIKASNYNSNGPIFILTNIKLGGRRNLAKPLRLIEIKNRFMEFLSKNNLKILNYDY